LYLLTSLIFTQSHDIPRGQTTWQLHSALHRKRIFCALVFAPRAGLTGLDFNPLRGSRCGRQLCHAQLVCCRPIYSNIGVLWSVQETW